ncbi:T3SS effector cysteine protease YopT [Yersinia pseudotuberculosis]|uniref:type III secretion system effector cysteine protease YopT n=1 Tax=Yersinia pseudotuberculosis TaxID=633 RepID=UPI0005E0F116|nr:T3SS effector cysteine protease YopT [Yersinia pseudotuberculosis]PSH11211.1 cysteine protease [Yersinia pseudotuberculosis]PSH37546.1 cysteine protease [Yersinia pseudotuberculosis]PSH39785.1 cysteine protease [Yersinia pseudotuberculosis]CNK84434.1 plasmid type III secretion system effector protein [Yersinia pseudotuberculosis]
MNSIHGHYHIQLSNYSAGENLQSATLTEGMIGAHRVKVETALSHSNLQKKLSATIKHNQSGRSMLDRKLTSDGKANQRSSFTFSMIMYRMIHFVLSTRVPAVRESVANYGGNINFKFAQTKGAFLHKIIKHSDTASGVCEALCAHWIRSHAQGQSLFDQLYVGGRKGKFQIDTLYSIKQLQIDGCKADVDQDEVTLDWFKKNGISERMIERHCLLRPVDVTGTTESEGLDQLLNAILDTHGIGYGYKKIHLSGQMSAHAIAAYVNEKSGVTFFDPNFGEFHFSDKEKFRKWFTNSFWDNSMYHYPLGVGQRFRVLTFDSKEV